jgi:hypothetical protein
VMIKKNDIFNRTLVGLGILLSFLVVLLLVATWLMNHEPLQGKIRKAVVRRTADSLRFQHLTVSLFPRPHVTVSNATIKVNTTVQGTVHRAQLYPEIIPLLCGNVQLAQASIEVPDLTVNMIDEPHAADPESLKTVSPETPIETEAAVTTIRSIAPRFSVRVSSGTLTLRLNGSPLTRFDDLNGVVSLGPRGFETDLAARTARWGALSVNGTVMVLKDAVVARNLSVSAGHSSLSGVSGRFTWRKTPFLVIRSGEAVIGLDDVYEHRTLIRRLLERLGPVKTMQGTIRISELQFRGRLSYPETWDLRAAGLLEKIVFDSRSLPGAVRIDRGGFTATAHSLSVTGIRARFIDSSGTASVGLHGSFKRIDSVNLLLNGKLGPGMLRWAGDTFEVPKASAVRAPLVLSGVRFAWRRGPVFSLSGKAAVINGPVVSGEMKWNAAELRIDRMSVEDGVSSASLAFRRQGKQRDISFRGILTADTVNAIFSNTSFTQGWIRGDFRARLFTDRPGESAAQGVLAAADVIVPRRRGKAPVVIRQVDLTADNKIITMNSGSFVWAGTPFDMKGLISAAEDGFLVDMDVNAGTINVARITKALRGSKPGKRAKAPAAPPRQPAKKRDRLPLLGIVRVYADTVLLRDYRFRPVTADILLDRQSVRLKIIDANLCGISFSGYLQRIGKKTLLDLQPAALKTPLEPAIDCLFGKRRVTGTFTFIGKAHAFGRRRGLLRSLEGSVEFTAKDGRIYSLPTLARVFALLNVTELLRGKLPDMGRDGFAYSSITIKGEMQKGKLLLREAALTGATLNLAAAGEIDFGSDRIDVTVLVAPFKTLEYILSKIPLVRNILANRLITVPVRLTGSLSNPDITLLDPQAIGENILEIMRRILELPFLVLSPDRQ